MSIPAADRGTVSFSNGLHTIPRSEIAMSTSAITPTLFLFTLIAVLVVAVIAYVLFLRKRGNRHPVEHPSKAGRTMAPTKDEGST
jgi:hypothetical protein